MNWLDLAIFFVLALSVLFGLYKGFIRTVAGIVSFILAWVIALSFYPLVASGLKKSPSFVKNVKYYTGDNSRLGDSVDMPVTELETEAEAKNTVNSANVPAPINKLLVKNVMSQSFLGLNRDTLGEYLNETVFHFAVNLIAFLILFLSVKIICSIVLHAIDYAMKLPILSNLNTALGGIFGFISGILLLFVVFSIIPVILSAVPSATVEKMLSESFFSRFFTNANIISGLLRGF
jgi:uncharacterized membrane protein required for colicin V production